MRHRKTGKTRRIRKSRALMRRRTIKSEGPKLSWLSKRQRPCQRARPRTWGQFLHRSCWPARAQGPRRCSCWPARAQGPRTSSAATSARAQAALSSVALAANGNVRSDPWAGTASLAVTARTSSNKTIGKYCAFLAASSPIFVPILQLTCASKI